MSDILYNEAKINNVPYKKGDWEKVVVHNDVEIKGFFGNFRFLSNFEPCDIFGYPSVENAYMAAKIVPEERTFFKTCTATEAKKGWRKYTPIDKTAEEWDARKYDIMARLVFEKFLKNKELRQKLLDTGDKYLEEYNWWKDTYWGVDIQKGGQNNLGKILMKVRTFWK